MSNQERFIDKESGSEPLARVFYGEGDTPELWQRVGMRLPDANIIAGAERSYGSLRPVLEKGVTVILQQGNNNALVLRGAVEEEDHFSLSSVAYEASEKKGRIPEPPHVAGIAWNEDLQQKAREDWQNAYDILVQRSPNVRNAIENAGAWLILDSKEDLKGFSIAQNEWRKDVLDGHLSNLDDQFALEVKKLETKYEDSWKGVGKADGELPTRSWASRALTGVALASSLPFNPALHVQDVPALIQPADANIMIIISQKGEVDNVAFAENSNPTRENKTISRGVNSALDFYDNYVDKFIPDTSTGQIDKAKGVLGIDKSENVEGGFSTLAKYAYDDVLARGGTEEDAIFAVKAAGMGFFQSPDGSKWYHVYGREEAKLEEVTRAQVEKNTSVKAIAAALAEAYESGGWGSNEPIGGTPVTSPTTIPTTESIQNSEVPQQMTGSIGFGTDNVESDFLAGHSEFNADNTTPISIEVSGKNFNMIEAGDGRYYIQVNGVWKELIKTEQLIGNQNFIVLQYFSRPPQPGDVSEAVLWYPAFTEDQWKNMTPDEKAQPWVAFAPPAEMENEIPGYSRNDDGGIALNITSGDNVPTFLISLELKNTSFTEPSKDATQIPPSEVITPTPPLPTPTEAPTLVPETKEFENCSAEKYNECYIAPEDLDSFADWTKRQLIDQGLVLPQPDPNKVFARDCGGDGSAFCLDKVGGGGVDKNDRWFMGGYSFGYTQLDKQYGDGSHKQITYAVSTMAFSVPGKPGEIVVIPVLKQFFPERSTLFVKQLHQIQNDGSFLIALIDEHNMLKPVDQYNEDLYPDLESRVTQFENTLNPEYIDGVTFEIFTFE